MLSDIEKAIALSVDQRQRVRVWLSSGPSGRSIESFYAQPLEARVSAAIAGLLVREKSVDSPAMSGLEAVKVVEESLEWLGYSAGYAKLSDENAEELRRRNNWRKNPADSLSRHKASVYIDGGKKPIRNDGIFPQTEGGSVEIYVLPDSPYDEVMISIHTKNASSGSGFIRALSRKELLEAPQESFMDFLKKELAMKEPPPSED